MPTFKNKKTGKIIKEDLLYYIEKLRKDSNYVEVNLTKKDKEKPKKQEVEVEVEQPLQ